MKKTLLLVLSGILFMNIGFAQKSLWQLMSRENMPSDQSPAFVQIPYIYQGAKLDFVSMKKILNKAPMEFKGGKPVIIDLPMPDGEIITFKVWESPTMEEQLMNEFPDIKSYSVQAVNNARTTGRIDISPYGFGGFISNSEKGMVVIDPLFASDVQHYLVAYKSDYAKEGQSFEKSCLVSPQQEKEHAKRMSEMKTQKPQQRNLAESQSLRIYTIGISASAEYSLKISPSKDTAAVIAELNKSVNRISLVLLTDLGIKFKLIGSNKRIVFFDPINDGFTAGDLVSMINQNAIIMTQNLGTLSGMDLGHVYGFNPNGGVVGLAQLGAVCSGSSKVRAGSTLGVVTGDQFWIDIVAHEMGHQMGANHSFNNCVGNESGQWGWEPGAGITIMSYSGTCPGPGNGASFDMFNAGSLEELTNYMWYAEGNGCAEKINENNTRPEVSLDYKDGFTIPKLTPFILEGDAIDAEGDTMTYSWEQADGGFAQAYGTATEQGPLYSVTKPSANKFRYFPRIGTIISNGATADELLPDTTRNLTFRFVVRDNHYTGGHPNWDEVKFKATDLAGPFRVLVPNTNLVTWIMGNEETVTWDVANTHNLPVNCTNVDIFLSANGGLGYPILLAKGVPNDGSATIICPPLPTNSTQARVMIKASENIFFDVSNQNFSIIQPDSASYYFDAQTFITFSCLPTNFNVEIYNKALLGFNQSVSLSTEGLPTGANAVFSKNPIQPGDAVSLSITLDNSVPSGILEFNVVATTVDATEFKRPISISLKSTAFSTIDLLSPALNADGLPQIPSFTWSSAANAEKYEFNISEYANFDPLIESSLNLVGTNFTTSKILDPNKIFYWRVRAKNSCANGEWSDTYLFHTVTLSCKDYKNLDGKISISASGKPSIDSKSSVLVDGIISDINLQTFKGFHEYFGDLDVTLTSPTGTKSILWTDKCGNFSNSFNFGLDDQSPIQFSCPPNGNKVFKPQEAFTKFNGESSGGDWILNVKDDNPSDGGVIDEWSLRICTNISANPPQLVVNDTLKLLPQTGKKITNLNLECIDDNNTNDEIRYTIVRNVRNGVLGNGSKLFEVGDRFTQEDINNNIISYTHTVAGEQFDDFMFVAEDVDGGWIPLSMFNIKTDNSITVSSSEAFNSQLMVFPNPASGVINIRTLNTDIQLNKIELINASGQLVKLWNTSLTNNNQLDTDGLSSGYYIIRAYTEDKFITLPLTLVK